MSEAGVFRSLRWRMLAFVLAVSASFVGGTWLMQRAIVQPEFAELEQREADANLARVAEAIERDADVLARSAQDYAAWDDTLSFVGTRDPAYVEANLIPETFANLGTDALLIVARSGELVWGRRVDEASGELVEDADLVRAVGDPKLRMLDHRSAASRKSGVVLTPRGPLLIGSAAITNSGQEVPPSGSVLFARFLDADLIAGLSDRTRVVFSVTPLDKIAGSDRAASSALARGDSGWHDISNPETLLAYSHVRDVRGEPSLLLRIELPRETSQRAAAAADLTAASGAVGGAALLGVMWLVLARFVVGPLERVTSHALRVGASGDLGARLGLTSRDEIGILAREFDAMVARLEESRAQLLDVAHQAGRAELATTILHDIGNVLNSVTVSASVAIDTLTRSEIATLGHAIELLRQNASRLPEFLTTDPRGQHLLPFLEELAAELVNERQRALGELKTLGVAIEYIATLVRAQNQKTRARPVLELLDPGAVAERALALAPESGAPHKIVFERHFETSERVPLDRHRCVQVLANLLANARSSVRDAGRGSGSISLGVARAHDASGEWVDFVVRDDGVGIASERLEAIFQLGYSTSAGGQGIGLHSAANLAREMGGSLRVESDGPDRGAAFTLRVPVREEAV